MSKPFRRRLQVSLKSLFIAILIVAAFFGGYNLATRHARDAVRRAEDAVRAEREAREQSDAKWRSDLILQTWKASIQAQPAPGAPLLPEAGGASQLEQWGAPQGAPPW